MLIIERILEGKCGYEEGHRVWLATCGANPKPSLREDPSGYKSGAWLEQSILSLGHVQTLHGRPCVLFAGRGECLCTTGFLVQLFLYMAQIQTLCGDSTTSTTISRSAAAALRTAAAARVVPVNEFSKRLTQTC